MRVFKHLFAGVFIGFSLFACKGINKTQKGAEIGTAGGAAVGTVIGKASGNSSVGTIIGATVGGVTGAVIGTKMDKQADDIKKEVKSVKVERVAEGIVVEFKNKILFGVGSANLTTISATNLDLLAHVLNKYPDTNIEIQGHSDNKGITTENQTLSEARANAVAGYLKKKDINSARMTTQGFGDSFPKYSNNSEKGRSENRRVEFLITANEKMKEEAAKEAAQSGSK